MKASIRTHYEHPSPDSRRASGWYATLYSEHGPIVIEGPCMTEHFARQMIERLVPEGVEVEGKPPSSAAGEGAAQ